MSSTLVDKGEGRGREKFGVVEEGAMAGYGNNEMLATEEDEICSFKAEWVRCCDFRAGEFTKTGKQAKHGKTLLKIAVKRNIANGSICAPPLTTRCL